MLPFLELGSVRIPLYGLIVTFGYSLGVVWLMRNREKMKLEHGEYWALSYALLFGALAGGRIAFYLVEWGRLAETRELLAYNWRTGWVFWGGFSGSMAAGWVFLRIHGIWYRPRKFLPLGDYFGAVAICLGHSFGRLACIFEGCCYGIPTRLPWGIAFTHPAASVPDELMGVPLHPVAIYESAGSFVIFFLLYLKILPGIQKKRYTYGSAFLLYNILYGAMRFFLEFLRGDDRGSFLVSWLSPGQWMSLIAIGACGAVLYAQGLRERSPKRRSLYRSRPS